MHGFTGALRMELESERSVVSCTTFHPGCIATNIICRARFDLRAACVVGRGEGAQTAFDRIAMTGPEKSARKILAADERNHHRVLIGPGGKVNDLISRLPACTSAQRC